MVAWFETEGTETKSTQPFRFSFGLNLLDGNMECHGIRGTTYTNFYVEVQSMLDSHVNMYSTGEYIQKYINCLITKFVSVSEGVTNSIDMFTYFLLSHHTSTFYGYSLIIYSKSEKIKYS